MIRGHKFYREPGSLSAQTGFINCECGWWDAGVSSVQEDLAKLNHRIDALEQELTASLGEHD